MPKSALALFLTFGGLGGLSGDRALGQDGGNNDADRYCEFVAVYGSAAGSTGFDYASYGLNDCPQDWWDGIDWGRVATDFGADTVVVNGPRYFVMDELVGLETNLQTVDVNGLNLALVATVDLPPEVASGGGSAPYEQSTVTRYTRYTYFAGSTIYELTDPEGQRYVMQSYSIQANPDLSRAALEDLGPLLGLPPGWSYATPTLEQDLFLCANGLAYVVQDRFGASYQLVNGEPCVLSAYFGAVILPQGIDRTWCPRATAAGGLGGMPFALDQPIGPGEMGWYRGVEWALDPAIFEVTVGPHGQKVTPVCATLQPAIDASEQRTVLLAGAFGVGGGNVPTEIRVVGDLETQGGNDLEGLGIVLIFTPDTGSNLTFAELLDPADGTVETSGPGDTAYCPREGTSKVLKLTFSGGVSAAEGGTLVDSTEAMAAILVVGVDADGGRAVVNPFALRDDDGDNYLDACLGRQAEGLRFETVSLDALTVFSPMNAANRAAAVRITSP